jgi:glutathione S-transferase
VAIASYSSKQFQQPTERSLRQPISGLAAASHLRMPSGEELEIDGGSSHLAARPTISKVTRPNPAGYQGDSLLSRDGHRQFCARFALAGVGVSLFIAAMFWVTSTAYLTASCDRTSSSTVPSTDPLVIYYWPELARAAALFRMCDHAGQPYVHNSTPEALASVVNSNQVHGPNGTSAMFAPPVVQDGDFFVSQSVAATLYLGQKLGFDRSVPSLAKAVQHLNDLQDFTGECSRATASLQKDRDAAPLRTFVRDGRFSAWVGTIEHAITGPYYYGDAVTYVDFYFLQTLDWFAVKVFDPLQRVTGDVWQRFPKVKALHQAMRAMPSYASTGAHGPLIPGVFTDEDVALYAGTG